jgi:hypothetical protein
MVIMRHVYLSVLVFAIGGCALPVPLQIASWAVSGFSYATTGKSVSDHAFSAIASKDCALHRVMLGEEICNPVDFDGTAIAKRDPEQETPKAETATTKPEKSTVRVRESMIALAENLNDDLQPASGGNDAAPLDSALQAMADTLDTIERKGETMPDQSPAKRFLVIGRYEKLADAEMARKRHEAHSAAVRMVLENGALLYQVTAGPLSRQDADKLESKLGKLGLKLKIAMLCADRATPAPCGGTRTQLTALPPQ